MYWINRIRLILNGKNISFFLKVHRLFKKDSRYSVFNLIKAMWEVSKHDRILRHGKRYVYSSFLPPVPSRAAAQVIHGVEGQYSAFDDHINARRKAPVSVYVAVTGRCPYRCTHCSAKGLQRSGERSTKEMKALFANLQDMGTGIIGITGGEPLLRDDLCELISGIDNRSVSYLFTSGKGLTVDLAQKLSDAGLFAIGISLDSANALEMDECRGVSGAFHTALDAMAISRRAGLYTMAQTVVTPDKLQTEALEKIIRLGAEKGVHEVRFLETMPTGRLVAIHPSKILTIKQRNWLKDFHIRMNRVSHYPKVSVFAHTEDHARYGCGAGTQHSYIDSSGNLYPCDFVPLAFGNVWEKPVAELWKKMNRSIGKPRRQCMIMELYEKNILHHQAALPLSPDASFKQMEQLEKVDALPGFYRTLKGKR